MEFPPLPPGRAPEVSVPEVVMRAANDSSGSLNNRLITVTGFILNEPGGADLARIVIICCAADAQLARIHLRDVAGNSVFQFADNTWIRVEGEVTPASGNRTRRRFRRCGPSRSHPSTLRQTSTPNLRGLRSRMALRARALNYPCRERRPPITWAASDRARECRPGAVDDG